MAKLTAKQRAKLPPSAFALPAKKGYKPKYPVEDPAHAGNAKARATQQVKKGAMSAATEKKIDAKADAELGKGKKH